MGRPGLPVLNMLCGTVIKVVIGLPLLSIPSLNIAGAAIGTVACYAVCAILSVYCVLKFSGATFYFGDIIAKPALATALMAVAAHQVYLSLAAKAIPWRWLLPPSLAWRCIPCVVFSCFANKNSYKA